LTALIQMRKDVLKPVHLAPHFVEYLSLKWSQLIPTKCWGKYFPTSL
jgi:hypothetical protein